MMEKKISVIIPTYNLCNYIGRCLESVMNQTYDNLEIIVVDDGSVDNTNEIVQNYINRDKRIKYIYQKNKGVTSARLYGVSNASGELVTFVDGDDLIEVNMYERLVNNLEEYNADISHCGYQIVFPDGHIDFYYNTDLLVLQDNENGLIDLLEGKKIEPGLVNKIYKKELFNDLQKKLDLKIKINEDLLMNYFLFKESKKSVFDDFCPYHYVLRRNSATTSKLNEYKLKNPIEVLKILQKDTENRIVLNQIVNKRLVYQMINIATLSLGEQKSLIFPYRKKIRKELSRNIIRIITNKAYNQKLKIMTIWTVICPSSYRWVHTLYMKITGIDKKYKLD